MITNRLYDYLDGTLDHEEEIALFNELSKNEALRAEFRDILAIDTAVKNDRLAFIPPVESTNKIFTTLGFAAPLAVATSETIGTTNIIQRISSWFTANSALLVTGISSFILSLTLLASFVHFSADKISLSSLSNEDKKKVLEEAREVLQVNQHSREISHYYSSNESAKSKEIIRYVEKPIRNNKLTSVISSDTFEPNSVVNQDLTTETNQKSAAISQDTSPLLNGNLEAHSSKVLENTFSVKKDKISNSIATISESSPETLPPFEISIRGISARSSQNSPIQSLVTPLFSNMALGIFINANENHAFGIEVGQEAFAQSFSGELNGRFVQFYQNPMLPWLGVSYKYTMSPSDFYFGVSPFAQVVAGGTQVGMLGRSVIGLSYSPQAKWKISLGVEGSLLQYQYQNSSFSTFKYGITYGMSYKF